MIKIKLIFLNNLIKYKHRNIKKFENIFSYKFYLVVLIKFRKLIRNLYIYMYIYKNTLNFYKKFNFKNLINFSQKFNYKKKNKIKLNFFKKLYLTNHFYIKNKNILLNFFKLNVFIKYSFFGYNLFFYYQIFNKNFKKFIYSNKNYTYNKLLDFYESFLFFYCDKNIYYNNYFFSSKNIIQKDKNNFIFTKFNNQIILGFLEKFFKKNFFIKSVNNFSKNLNNNKINILVNENKFTGYSFNKYFSIKEFIEIVWYSMYFKDLSMISNWVTKQMEKMAFKNHKRFITFFQNFFLRNCDVFLNVLMIKGFFFDIRGKVGVTGSSKKRHISFKIGVLNKSDKINNIDINQNLVRTYSGVLGLTYIVSY